MSVKRNYRYSDVNLLTGSATVIESAIAHQVAITAKRPLWTLAFFNTLKTRVNDAFPDFLGIDNAATMRAKTDIVNAIMLEAEPKLTTFKKQVERDFKNDPNQLDEILTTLGFKFHYKAAKAGDQEATIELLFKFDTNMTPALLALLTNIDPVLITDLRAMATTLKNANIDQESAKSLRGEITDSAVTEFNDIHSVVSDVCVICADLFKTDKTIQKQFHLAAVIDKIDGNNPPPPGP